MHGNLVRCGVFMKEARRATKQVVADTMAFAFLMIGAWHGADVLSFFWAESGRRSQFSACLCPAGCSGDARRHGVSVPGLPADLPAFAPHSQSGKG